MSFVHHFRNSAFWCKYAQCCGSGLNCPWGWREITFCYYQISGLERQIHILNPLLEQERSHYFESNSYIFYIVTPHFSLLNVLTLNDRVDVFYKRRVLKMIISESGDVRQWGWCWFTFTSKMRYSKCPTALNAFVFCNVCRISFGLHFLQ